MKHSDATRARNPHHHRLVRASACALGIVCVACSADEGGSNPPAGNTALGGASTSSGSGGAGGSGNDPNGPSATTGGSGSASPSTERPAAGNDTPIDGTASSTPSGAPNGTSTGVGGSAAAGNGSAGSSMVAAAGSSMVAAAGSGMESGAAAGAAGQGGSECASGAFFCEDFEGIALGPLPAVNGMQPERTVNVIADPARGQVLQVLAGSAYANKAGFFLNDFVRPDNGSHFGRMFVNPGAFPVLDSDHWVLVELTGAVGDQVRPVGGQFQRWAPGADGMSAGDWTDWEQSTVATVAGSWQCVEWQMDGANGGNDMLLWVDGVQVQPLDRPSFTFPAFNRLWIGWVVYLAGQPNQYDVRFDDIILSTQRVGCD